MWRPMAGDSQGCVHFDPHIQHASLQQDGVTELWVMRRWVLSGGPTG